MENIFVWGYCDPKLPIKEDLRTEIDLLYQLHDSMHVGDRVLYEGRYRHSLTIERVSQGLILVVTDHTITDLHQQEQLTAIQRGSYAGFGPTLLKSRYATSQLLKRLLTDLPRLGIDIHGKSISTLTQ